MKLPSKVDVIEVGPRDGFQKVKAAIPTATKHKVIDAIIASGVRKMEVTSFVHPKAVPQMADAAEVAAGPLREPTTGVILGLSLLFLT